MHRQYVKISTKYARVYLHMAWQWYIVFCWRAECLSEGYVLPPLDIIR